MLWVFEHLDQSTLIYMVVVVWVCRWMEGNSHTNAYGTGESTASNKADGDFSPATRLVPFEAS